MLFFHHKIHFLASKNDIWWFEFVVFQLWASFLKGLVKLSYFQELQTLVDNNDTSEDSKEVTDENLSTKIEVEQEMKELVSQEDEEIKDQYEINEGEENNIDSNTDEQKLESESLE